MSLSSAPRSHRTHSQDQRLIKEAKHAEIIAPVRKQGNLLLCTLLLGNVAVNSLLSIFMAQLSGGMLGFLLSTGLIVIIGEIIPQAVCSRHALPIGAAMMPLVKLFMILMFFLSYPISVVLDWALGREIGTIYSKDQLKLLLEIYAQQKGSAKA